MASIPWSVSRAKGGQDSGVRVLQITFESEIETRNEEMKSEGQRKGRQKGFEFSIPSRVGSGAIEFSKERIDLPLCLTPN
jgi:hypothetical protein